MRIVFLGDSLTWGGYGGSFVNEVAHLLPGHDIINAGVPGNTVLNLRDRLDSVFEHQPDGVFVMVGGNDAVAYTQPAARAYYQNVQKVPNGIVTPDLFAQTYRDLLTQLQTAHSLAWVGLAPIEYNPLLVDTLALFNRRAAQTAAALNIPVIDLAVHFAPRHLPDRPPIDQAFINLIGKRAASGWQDYESERARGGFTFTFDGMHLLPDAARQIAHLIVEFLELS